MYVWGSYLLHKNTWHLASRLQCRGQGSIVEAAQCSSISALFIALPLLLLVKCYVSYLSFCTLEILLLRYSIVKSRGRSRGMCLYVCMYVCMDYGICVRGMEWYVCMGYAM